MKLPQRRRREGKTDYARRLKLLKSARPRIVIRKTNKYLIMQYVESEEARDKIGVGYTSKKLLEYGWPKEMGGKLKSMPAAYLTGFLLGKSIKKKGSNVNVVIDIGMLKNIPGSRVYAAMKGLKDAGVIFSADDKIFPSEERIKGRDPKIKLLIEQIQKKF
jgi:large subunit ribosomal protein L18